jgi:hypothetical protein
MKKPCMISFISYNSNPYLELDFQKDAGKCDFFLLFFWNVAKAALLFKSPVVAIPILTFFLK